MRQTHIKSKVLSIALAFLIAVTMTPCWAIMTADEASAGTEHEALVTDKDGKNVIVARIGEKANRVTDGEEKEILNDGYFENLNKAINFADDGDTIKLLKDVAAPEEFTFYDEIFHRDREISGTNMIYFVKKGGDFTLNGDNHTLTGGIADSSFTDGPDEQNITDSYQKSITIKDITVNAGICNALWLLSPDEDITNTMTVESGSYTSNSIAVMVNGGTMNINGGTYNGAQYDVVAWGQNNEYINKNPVVNITEGVFNGNLMALDNGTIKIRGGKFNGTLSNTLEYEDYKYESGTISITGGYFTTDVTDFCAKGYECVDDTSVAGYSYKVQEEGDTTNVAQIGEGESAVQYPTLRAAIEVATNGQTVKMIANETVEYAGDNNGAYASVTGDKDITLDLNGFTVKGTSNTDGYTDLIFVQNGSKLTVKDTSSTKNGALKYTDLKDNNGGATIRVWGRLDVEGGTIENLTKCVKSSIQAAIDVYANEWGSEYDPKDLVFNLKGGTIKSKGDNTIRLTNFSAKDPSKTPTSVTVNVTGGKVEGGADAFFIQGVSDGYFGQNTLNILGGEFDCKQPVRVFGNNFTTEYTATDKPVKVNISGGKFKETGSEKEFWKGITIQNYGKDNADIVKTWTDVQISGGLFSYNKSLADGVVSGKAVIDNTDESTKTAYPYTIGDAVNVAKIGSTEYPSLAAAIADVKNGQTIKMLDNVEGAHGISVSSDKKFTVDFDGHSYSVEKPGAGSAGTKTQAFQLLENSNITFKNGTISCTAANKDATWSSDSTEKGVAMIIQNYANLTLENMTIDGTNIAHNGNNVRYMISNNSGTVNINNSKITAPSGDFAFDSCKYGNYDKPKVNVLNSTINGRVEATGGDIELQAGTILNGMLRVGENKKDTAVKDSEVTIKNGATVNGIVAVFGENTLNILGEVNGYVLTNGNAYNAGSKINIKDGAKITCEDDVAVYMPNGTLNISGGEITGETAVYFKSTNLDITGGKLTGTGNKQDYNYDGNGANATGDALVIDSCNYPNGIQSVEVSGGYFKSINGKTIASYKHGDAAKKTGFVTGGYLSKDFETYGDKDVLATEYEVIGNQDEDSKTDYPKVVSKKSETKYVIQTKSALNGTDKSVATVSGGGVYKSGALVTLEAPVVDNLEFDSWYKGSVTENNKIGDGSRICTDTPINDTIYIANYVSKSGEQVTVKAKATGSAASRGSVTVSGVTGDNPSKTIDVGESVTMTASVREGEGEAYFIAWQNKNGAVLSTSPEYTTTAIQSQEVEAVFLNEGAALVDFKDDNGNLIKSGLYAASEAGKVTTVVAVSKKGQKFNGWVDQDGETKLTDTEVKALIQKAAKDADDAVKGGTGSALGKVTVKAEYESVGTYTVNVQPLLKLNDKAATVLGQPTVFNGTVGEPMAITADAKTQDEKYTFQGFCKDSSGTTIIATKKYTVSPAEKDTVITIYTVYGESQEFTEKPNINFEEPFNASTNVAKIGYTMSWYLPEGYKLVSAGFIFGTSEESMDRTSTTTLTGNIGAHTLNLNVDKKRDDIVFIKAFVKYKDGNEEKIVYSEMKNNSFTGYKFTFPVSQ